MSFLFWVPVGFALAINLNIITAELTRTTLTVPTPLIIAVAGSIAGILYLMEQEGKKLAYYYNRRLSLRLLYCAGVSNLIILVIFALR